MDPKTFTLYVRQRVFIAILFTNKEENVFGYYWNEINRVLLSKLVILVFQRVSMNKNEEIQNTWYDRKIIQVDFQ